MIYVVTGQTATGKTDYAIELAHKHNGELINVDSRQIYKYLDIITGKDLDLTTKEFHKAESVHKFDIGYYKLRTTNYELSTRIWLYDIVDPKLPFSSHDYEHVVKMVIEDIIKRGKTPILVGGTYFYLKHLLYNLLTYHVKPNWQLRKDLESKSVQELQEILNSKSPELFKQLNSSELNNPQRLIRKIELVYSGIHVHVGEFSYTFNNFFKSKAVTMIGFLHEHREVLLDKIKKRVQKRIQYGAIEEVKSLLQKGYTENDHGLKTIGYAQCIDFLKNRLTHEEMVTSWIAKEVQYAKRQYTFMKKDPHIKWITVS